MASTSQVKKVNLILLTCEEPENVSSADLGKSPNLPEQFLEDLIHFDEHICTSIVPQGLGTLSCKCSAMKPGKKLLIIVFPLAWLKAQCDF